jgi:diacylglycerol kinase family enzyme
MPGPVVVLINDEAGALKRDPALTASIEKAFADAGVTAEVRRVPCQALVATARELVGHASAVVAAGGDGTISSVASALVGTSTPMGVMPVGTLNHFAKDAGLPLELEPAVKAIVAGHVRQVDVAEVNGHVFVNNSSVGMYPHMVEARDEETRQRGTSKWVAMWRAFVDVLRRFPLFDVRLLVDGQQHLVRTPIVFVGNNVYQMSLLSPGKREQLDGGQLCVYVARTTSRWGLFVLALRAIFKRLEQARDFVSWCSTEVQVITRKRRPLVSRDGEIDHVTSPLDYRIRPGALRLLVPAP